MMVQPPYSASLVLLCPLNYLDLVNDKRQYHQESLLALVKLSERAAKVGFPWDLSWFKYLSWSIYLVYNELKSCEI